MSDSRDAAKTGGAAPDAGGASRQEGSDGSETQWRAFIENFPDFYVKIDRQGRFLYSNRVDPTTTMEQLLQATTFDYVRPDHHQQLRDHLDHVWTSRETVDFDFPAVLLDGEHWYRTRIFPIVEHGQVVALGEIAVDITERRRAEEALRRNEERWKNFIDNFPHYYTRLALDGTFLLVSQVDEHLEGDLTGTSVYEILPADAQEITRYHLERLAACGEPASYESRTVFEDGEHWYRSTMWPVREDGEIVAADLITIEITEQKRLENQLRHAQKMQAIGELAGGVAHDFNNLLVGILGSADLLLAAVRERGVDVEVQDLVRTIRRASLRAADLTAQLLAFSRKGILRTEVVDMHHQVDEVVRLLGHTLDRRIRIQRQLEAPRAEVLGDPSQLQNALINLAVNARDAMPEGGTLCFRTRQVEVSPSEAGEGGGLQAGPHLELSIQDSGVGIPTPYQERIFEPFFTTKATGEGTGLGLAAVYGTVQSHHGVVTVASTPGRGTTFQILLPMAPPCAPTGEGPGAPSAPELVHGEGTVLLIDDEELVRVLGAAMLRRLGYQVRTAEDGEAGLEVYQQHRDEIDAVVLDLVMPRIDGRETLRRLREIAPDLPVLVSSGFADAERSDDFLHRAADGFLRKPYLAGDFSRAISDVMARRRRG